jgi:hypothetical protein
MLDNTFFAELKEAVEANIDARLTLLQLDATEKAARLMSALIVGLLAGGLCFFVLIFVSIMAGYLFAHYTGSLIVGFSIVAGFYSLLFLLTLLLRKKISTWLADTIVKLIFNKTEHRKE